MKTSLLRSSALTAALALAALAPAGAAFAAESPQATINAAVDAIAAHNQKQALSLISSASDAIAAKHPASPAVVNLRFARENLLSGHGSRAIQDLYAAAPLVDAAN
jgi:hypothetical protein